MAETSIAALAAILDKYVEVRDRRRKMEAEAEALKEKEESPLKAQLIEALRTAKAGSVGGTKMQAKLVTKKSFQAAEWPKIRTFIVDNDAWELMQLRLSPPAIRERLDAGQEIPGIVVVDVEDLSITKL